ncbi:hypothetical protein BN903_45 [Halorubrum sp. AJ67]|nr:hypothetical protein BN903_45 [Halorubrum sp. AJ67]
MTNYSQTGFSHIPGKNVVFGILHYEVLLQLPQYCLVEEIL